MPKRNKAKRSVLASVLKQVTLVVFDFDGVFTDNRVLVCEDGREAVLCWRSDGLGLARLRMAGIPAVVLSTEKNPVVGKRCAKLQIRCIQGCDDKMRALKGLAAEYGAKLSQVAFIGNDTNDAACLEAVGFPICVADAHPSVLSHALYVTVQQGGRGAVREVCDLICEGRHDCQK